MFKLSNPFSILAIITVVILLKTNVPHCTALRVAMFPLKSLSDPLEEAGHEKMKFPTPPFEMGNDIGTLSMEEAKLELQKSLNIKEDPCYLSVFAELDDKCSTLNDDREKLGKIAVRLFNCAASLEKRPTFLCRNDMKLHQCTVDMDTSTWTAYRLISEHVISYCKSAQREIFRLQTEQTISNLLNTVNRQVYSLNDIQSEQQSLKEQIIQGQHELSQSQNTLLEKQELLEERQKVVEKSIEDNIALLVNAGEFLRENQEKLQDMSDVLGQTFDKRMKEMENKHDETMKSIMEVNKQAKNVQESMTETKMIIEKHRKEAEKYHHTAMGDLALINRTLHFVTQLLEISHEKLDWILSDTGDIKEKAGRFFIVLTHVSYFIVVGMFLAFFGRSMTTRYVFMGALLLKIVAEVYLKTSFLSFAHITGLLFFQSFRKFVKKKCCAKSFTCIIRFTFFPLLSFIPVMFVIDICRPKRNQTNKSSSKD